jgi:anti-sigma regulatory factor (Ser/Thr protein kinase)
MVVMQITVPAYHKKIEEITDLVGKAAEAAGFNDRMSYACQLAIGEACENVINHGYKKEGIGDLELLTRSTPGKLILQLRDSAPPFNPANSTISPEWEEGEPPIGGLGLYIIHRVMDKVNYQREGARNCLEMEKSSIRRK